MLVDIIGITGVALVLVAYFLIQIGRVSALSYRYCSLNLIGAILILYSLLYNWNLASVIIELAWMLISLWGFYRCYTASNRVKAG